MPQTTSLGQRGFFVSGDAHLTNTTVDGNNNLKPAMPKARMQAATAMVRKIGETIYLLDLTIEQWSEQLDRAQPHRNKRLVLCFAKQHQVRMEGDQLYDITPVVGQMILFKSGGWSFRKLAASTRYTNLRELRVGATLPSDPQVVRLIDGIEDMLRERAALLEMLASLSRSMVGRLSAITAMCDRRAGEAIDISERIKLDWTKGADEAEEAIREKRRARYARTKANKAAMAAGA